jgi:hypothetical protein
LLLGYGECNSTKNKGTQALSEPVLEKLSRTHIAVPLTIFPFLPGLVGMGVTHTSLSAQR